MTAGKPRFIAPAEWEPHFATWLAWPHEASDWPGKFTPVPHLYAEIVRILSRHERVRILIVPKLEAKARQLLRRAGADLSNVDFVAAATDRSWTRDYCPVWCRDAKGKLSAVKWLFNGWAKYPNSARDDQAGELAARYARTTVVRPKVGRERVVLEGGSIDFNGSGTMLTTEECLLSPVQARNPNLTREQMEALFFEYFGVTKTLWLHRGIAGDDTHGHVDDLARFVNPNTVVLAVEEDPAEDNYEPLQENLRLLRKMTLPDGNRVRVVPLPMPRPVYYAGQRLPASYANFYIANGVVIVPTFHDPNDRVALNTLAKLFPGRDVIGIHAVDLVLGLGTLHCMTMQQPA